MAKAYGFFAKVLVTPSYVLFVFNKSVVYIWEVIICNYVVPPGSNCCFQYIIIQKNICKCLRLYNGIKLIKFLSVKLKGSCSTLFLQSEHFHTIWYTHHYILCSSVYTLFLCWGLQAICPSSPFFLKFLGVKTFF